MNFKNIVAFRLAKDWKPTAAELSKRLKPFQPCGKTSSQSCGWAPPIEESDLAYSVAGQILLMLRMEERILPSAVIKKAANEKLRELEKQQGFKPGRKKMHEVREAVTAELLPRAFTKDRFTAVWIDPVNRLLVVDGSPARANEVVEHLKSSLDEVPLKLIRTAISPATAMSNWLAGGDTPTSFTIDRDCEMRSVEKATVKYARHALEGADIRHHLSEGKQVTRLAMTYNDEVSFVLTDTLEFKRISLLDVVLEKAAQNESDNQADAFDANFILLTGEISSLLLAVIDALGGEIEEEA